MSEVQVKVINRVDREAFERELAQALNEGWQIEEIFPFQIEDEHHLMAVLKRGGNEPVRGQGWMLSAIEGLQVKIARLEAKIQEYEHVLDLSGVGMNAGEAVDLMKEQLYEAISEGWRGVDEVEGKHDVHVEFWTPEEMQQYVKFQRLARVDLIDAEIARDLAGVR